MRIVVELKLLQLDGNWLCFLYWVCLRYIPADIHGIITYASVTVMPKNKDSCLTIELLFILLFYQDILMELLIFNTTPRNALYPAFLDRDKIVHLKYP